MKKIILVLALLGLIVTPGLAQATYSSSDTTSSVSSISLSGTGSAIKWTTYGTSDMGFKVVWSKTSGPTYPTRGGDQYHYYSESTRNFDTLSAFDGAGKYYVRVCEYLGGKCGKYSNEISVTLGEASDDSSDDSSDQAGEVTSIVLSSGTGNSVTWKTTGVSEQGFKVVWSKVQGPTYPNRSGLDRYHYYSNSSANSDTLLAFDGEGTYYVRVCEYLGGECGKYSNEITKVVASDVICSQEFQPVCGEDGKTYYNECYAKQKMGVAIAYYAECEKDAELQEMEDKAELLLSDKLDAILAELDALRSLVKEQQAEINYLKDLLADFTDVSEAIQTAINNFITYGVDENTEKLGAGERAAVMYSYKDAFGKVPSDETEMEDAIRIANGRWPVKVSEEAEQGAKNRFREVYLRDPDMTDPYDNAAVTIMAYGLRQKAQNRNLTSERAGINTFIHIFGFHPIAAAEHNMTVTEAWNIMQAITYSGAKR